MADELTDDYPVMRRRKVFNCPHCGERLVLPVSIQILEPTTYVEREEGAAGDSLLRFTPDQRAMIERAEKAGILTAFEQACRRKHGADAQWTKNIPKFFVTFLRTASARQLPQWVINHYRQEFTGHIDCWGAQGIVAICVAGKIRAFLPLQYAVGDALKTAAGGKIDGRLGRNRIEADPRDFQDWVRARMGYVPRECELFLREMRKRSIGEFADVRV